MSLARSSPPYGTQPYPKASLDSLEKSVQAELEQPYPRRGTIYSLWSVYYPNIR